LVSSHETSKLEANISAEFRDWVREASQDMPCGIPRIFKKEFGIENLNICGTG
jgi:hypothetical protein